MGNWPRIDSYRGGGHLCALVADRAVKPNLEAATGSPLRLPGPAEAVHRLRRRSDLRPSNPRPSVSSETYGQLLVRRARCRKVYLGWRPASWKQDSNAQSLRRPVNYSLKIFSFLSKAVDYRPAAENSRRHVLCWTPFQTQQLNLFRPLWATAQAARSFKLVSP